MGITRQHNYRVDLHKPLARHNVGVLLAEGDSDGDVISVALYQGNDKAVMDDADTVVAQFIRADGNTVVMQGVKLLHRAQVTLNESCYVREGRFTLTIKVVSLGTTTTVAIIDGMIRRTTTDSLVDPEEHIVNLSEAIALVENMSAATDAAIEAAQRAEEAAGGIWFDTKYNGFVVCIGADGRLTPLALGDGLEIVDGVLRVTGTIPPSPDDPVVPDDPDTPSVVTLSVDEEGNAVVTGAILTVDEEGNATLTGYTPVVDGDGDAII